MNLTALRTVKLLPAILTRLIDKSCAIRMSGTRFPRVNEHTAAHRRWAWATRGLASHTELPKMVGTIPTYIVYDNVAQCFGHEPLSGQHSSNHRPLEKTHCPERVGKSPAQLLIGQPHPHWLNMLGFNRFQRS